MMLDAVDEQVRASHRWRGAVLVGVLAAIFVINTGPIGDADYGLHLRIGQEIVDSLRPPTTDHHSYTLPNAAYPDHEWLAQALIYLGARSFGDGGMVVVKGLLVALALGLLALSLRGPMALRLTLLVTTATLAIKHSQVRPHLLAWVMVALLVLLLERKQTWAVMTLLLVWANTHGSVLLGVGVVGLRYLDLAWRQRQRLPLVWAALAAAVPLVNPQGWRVYTIFFAIRRHTDFISEWQPWTPESPYFWLIVVVVVAALAGSLLEKPRSLPTLALVIVLTVLALVSRRNGVVAALVLAPIIDRTLGPRLVEARRGLHVALAGAALLGLVSILGLRWSTGEIWALRVDEQRLPIAAIHFMRDRAVVGPVFNDYDFGGTLLWSGWPAYRVFIDGRTEVYAGAVLDEYLTVARAEPGWQAVLERYGVRSLLLRVERPLSRLLVREPSGWELAYFDDLAVLFVRGASAPGLRRLRALVPPGRFQGNDPELARAEVAYLLDANPRFLGGHKLSTLLHLRRRDFAAARTSLVRYLELDPRGIDRTETQAVIEALRTQGVWP